MDLSSRTMPPRAQSCSGTAGGLVSLSSCSTEGETEAQSWATSGRSWGWSPSDPHELLCGASACVCARYKHRPPCAGPAVRPLAGSSAHAGAPTQPPTALGCKAAPAPRQGYVLLPCPVFWLLQDPSRGWQGSAELGAWPGWSWPKGNTSTVFPGATQSPGACRKVWGNHTHAGSPSHQRFARSLARREAQTQSSQP